MADKTKPEVRGIPPETSVGATTVYQTLLRKMEGMRVAGYNQVFVEKVSNIFRDVGIADVRPVIEPNEIPPNHVKWPMTQRLIRITIGYVKD